MRASFLRHDTALIAAAFVAVLAAACQGDDRPSAAGDAADGLHPDSFVAPARAVSSVGARLADTALRRAVADRRSTTTGGTDVVIAGSPSGFALNDEVVQPHGGSAPPAPATREPETPTIIVNGPPAPKGGAEHDPRPGTSDTASARPCGAAGTSDTASRSPCGQPGTSDTASARRRVPASTPARATVPRRTIPWRRSPSR